MQFQRAVNRGAAALFASLLALGACGDDAPRSPVVDVDAMPALGPDTYGAYRDRIRPTETELAWEQIPWLTTYADGLRASSAQQKPLLLWVMNGHPLGCT